MVINLSIIVLEVERTISCMEIKVEMIMMCTYYILGKLNFSL